MASVTKTKKNWTHLCHDTSTDGVLVTTEEGDKFILSLEEAINGCKTAEKSKQFLEQFREIIGRLTAWLNERSDKVDRAYLTLSQEGLDFTVVLRAKEFDRDLEEALVELDIEIAGGEKFSLIKLDVMSLPYCSEEKTHSFVRARSTYVWQQD